MMSADAYERERQATKDVQHWIDENPDTPLPEFMTKPSEFPGNTPTEELAEIERAGLGPFYLPPSLADALVERYGRMPSNCKVAPLIPSKTVQITQQPQLVNGRQVVIFTGGDTFQSLYAAQAWCKERDISYSAGSARCGGVIGLLHGDFSIAKYHNLTTKERAQLDGTMSGDGRQGPITISIKPRSTP